MRGGAKDGGEGRGGGDGNGWFPLGVVKDRRGSGVRDSIKNGTAGAYASG